MENSAIKIVGVSVGSLAIGGGIGALVTRVLLKKKYDEKLAIEVGQLETWYKKKINEICENFNEICENSDELLRKRKKLVDDEEDDSENEDKQEETEKDRIMNSAEMKEAREKLRKNWRETTNYAAMYQVKEKKTDEEEHVYGDISVGPEDDDPEEENFTEEDKQAKALHDTHQKTKNRAPKIISSEAVSDLPPHVPLISLRYYQNNNVLVTEEDGEVIDDPGNFVGDCLTKYGFDVNDEDVIYVMNYSQDVAYEIQKVFGMYEEE